MALTGTWCTDAKHWRVEEGALGSSTFEWVKGGHFVVLGGDNDHEAFRDATCVIGRADQTPPAALADVAAVGLFCERARAHDPGFRLDDGNAAAVAEIAERLDAAIGASAAAPRDAPARQRTLRATIEWSHQLGPHRRSAASAMRSCVR